MRRTIRIALGENGRTLGTLRFDAQGSRESAAFEYSAEWLAAANRFAIEPGLPLVHASWQEPDPERSAAAAVGRSSGGNSGHGKDPMHQSGAALPPPHI